MKAAGRAPAAFVWCALLSTPLVAQHDHGGADSTRGLRVGAMAIGVYSNVNPGALNRRVSEAYLTQVMGMASATTPGGLLRAQLIVNAEGATLDRGEITPGAYGEGYIDRRHPHTWLHVATLSVRQQLRSVRVSASAGKGFVPFGSEDPMLRPLVKYPVNHHLAQVLERALVAVSAQAGPVTVEGSRFNGDEPQSPSDWPNADRLFDSWALRGTLTPSPRLALSASTARVRSPEFAQGDGLDQRKVAGWVRLARPGQHLRYALLEGARTREFSGDREAFSFSSFLAEGQLELGRTSLSARVERTTRPEEERTASPYRTIRPLLDFNILGRTRWTNLAVNVSPPEWGRSAFRGRPFVEVGYHVPRATRRPTPLDPVELFGGRQVWSVSAGLRLRVGHAASAL